MTALAFAFLLLTQSEPAARSGIGAAKVGATAYIFGGAYEQNGRFVNDVLTYDLVKKAWSNKALLQEPVAFPVVTAYAGKLYLMGGLHADGSTCGHAWMYDPASDRFVALAPLPTARSRASGAVVGGRIAVIGGIDRDGKNSDRVELYDPVAKTWGRIEPLPTPRHGQVSEFVKDVLVVAGGYAGNPMEMTRSVETWQSGKGWSKGKDLPIARGFAQSAVVNGTMMVLGNRGGAMHPLTFDPAKGKWSESKAYDVTRHRGAAVEHAGRVYVFFGEETGGKPVAVFDTLRDAWSTSAAD